MEFFKSDTIFFEVLGYGVSYIEFMGVVTGAVAVWLSARGNIVSWPLGIINVVLSFFLYYQVQLYPDMFLQIFFFVTNLIGWWRWGNPRKEEEDKKKQLRITRMNPKQWMLFSAVVVTGTLLLGSLASHLHEWVPNLFSMPSAFPHVDSFITVMSIVATYLMVQKKVECWALWVLLDAVATVLYYFKDIKFYSLEYLAFCFIAAYGFGHWLQEYRRYELVKV